jgi:hypothetical protein
MPNGMAISFCNVPVLGIRSVVTLMTDLSELKSSSDYCTSDGLLLLVPIGVCTLFISF